jgi:hypothetical protein
MPTFMEDRRIMFEALPEQLRHRYNHDPVVHMWISAWLYGRIERGAMMEGLASALAEKTAALEAQLIRYLEWFGAPPN